MIRAWAKPQTIRETIMRSLCSATVFSAALAILPLSAAAAPASASEPAPGGPEDAGMRKLQAILGMQDETAHAQASAALEERINVFVARVTESHPAVIAAKARTGLAEAQVKSGRDPFLPTLDAQGSISRTQRDEDAVETETDAASGALRFGWNLYHGGADALNMDRNELAAEQAGAECDALRKSYESALKRAFFRFNQTRMQLLLSEQAIKNSEFLTGLSRQKHDAGLVGGIDVMEARMQLQGAQAALASARSAIESARRGVSANVPSQFQVDPEFTALLAGLESLALPVGSPGMARDAARIQDASEKQALLGSDIAAMDVSLARRGRYLPSLDLFSTYGRNWDGSEIMRDDGLSTEAQGRGTTLSFGLELSVPLFAPRADSSIRSAKAGQLLAESRVNQLRFEADERWQGLMVDFEGLSASLPIYQSAYQSALELYDARLKLYRAGSADMFAVTDAEGRRLTALENWFQARTAVQNARLDLDAAARGLILGGAGGGVGN